MDVGYELDAIFTFVPGNGITGRFDTENLIIQIRKIYANTLFFINDNSLLLYKCL
jgi:hypothetical protein